MNILLFILITLLELILILFQQSEGVLVLRPINPDNTNDSMYELVSLNTMDNCEGYTTNGYTEYHNEHSKPSEHYTYMKNKISNSKSANLLKDFISTGKIKFNNHTYAEPKSDPAASNKITDNASLRKKLDARINNGSGVPNMLLQRNLGSRTVKRYYIPTLIVVDSSFLKYHIDLDYESYITTALTMVENYFADATIGTEILISIAKILYLDKESKAFDDPKAKERLRKFCEWANIHKPEQSNPEYYDIALLITRDTIMDVNGNRPVIGATYIGAACLPCKACAVIQDIGLLLGVNIAHHMGHLLGASNDDMACPRNENCHVQYRYVMSTHIFHDRLMWSERSRSAISNYFSCGAGFCLADEPPMSTYVYRNILPGVVYSVDTQCSMIYEGTRSCYLNKEAFCKSLFCTSAVNGTCINQGNQPLQGTQCGVNEWCFNLKCVHIGKRPKAVNGRWGPWGPWSPCSKSCGGGVRTARRFCNNPMPTLGGIFCHGPASRHEMCNIQHCTYSDLSFRALQCAHFNQVSISGNFHKWKPWIVHTTSGMLIDACMLYCVNEKDIKARLSPRVIDGTVCRLGTTDVCIDGFCNKVGCDWVLNSDAVEDQCKICGGPGTECTEVEGTFYSGNGTDGGRILVTQIPKWSTHIRIYETRPTTNSIEITLKNGTQIDVLRGNESSGLFEIEDKIGFYAHLQPLRAYLMIKGPLTTDINVLINVQSGGKMSPIHYAYMLFKEEPPTYVKAPEKPADENCDCNECVDNSAFVWEHIDKTGCSARCEIGTAISVSKCVSLNHGLVGDDYCDDLDKPKEVIFACNIHECEVRWRTGPWMRTCPPFRSVLCMKESRNWRESDIIVDSSLCRGPRPAMYSTDCEEDMNTDQIFDVKKVKYTSKYCFGPTEPLNRELRPQKANDQQSSTISNVGECATDDNFSGTTTTTTSKSCVTKETEKTTEVTKEQPKCKTKTTQKNKNVTTKTQCNVKSTANLNIKDSKTVTSTHTTKNQEINIIKHRKHTKATTKHRTQKDSLYDYYYYDEDSGADKRNATRTKNDKSYYINEIAKKEPSVNNKTENKFEDIFNQNLAKIKKEGKPEGLYKKTVTTFQMMPRFHIIDYNDYNDYNTGKTTSESKYTKKYSKVDDPKSLINKSTIDKSTKVNKNEPIQELKKVKSTDKSTSQVKPHIQTAHIKNNTEKTTLKPTYTKNDAYKPVIQKPIKAKKGDFNKELYGSTDKSMFRIEPHFHLDYNDYDEKTASSYSKINSKYNDIKYIIRKSTKVSEDMYASTDKTMMRIDPHFHLDYNDYDEKTTSSYTKINSKYNDLKSIIRKSTKVSEDMYASTDKTIMQNDPHLHLDYNDYNIEKVTPDSNSKMNSKYSDHESKIKKSTKVNEDEFNQDLYTSTDKSMLRINPHFLMDYNDYSDYDIEKTTLESKYTKFNLKYDDLHESTHVNNHESSLKLHEPTDKSMFQFEPHFHMDYNDFNDNEYKTLDNKAELNQERYKKDKNIIKKSTNQSHSPKGLPKKYLCVTKDCLKNTYGNFKNLAKILKTTSLEYKGDIDEALYKIKNKIKKENNKAKREVNYKTNANIYNDDLIKHLEDVLDNINNLKFYVSNCSNKNMNLMKTKKKKRQKLNKKNNKSNKNEDDSCCGFSYIEDYNDSCASETTLIKLLCTNYIDGANMDYVVKELGNDLPVAYELVQPKKI